MYLLSKEYVWTWKQHFALTTHQEINEKKKPKFIMSLNREEQKSKFFFFFKSPEDAVVTG